MDDDVKEALDELRQELRKAQRAPSPQRERDVREAQEDLDDVLRRHGYRLSRRELDAILNERDERRQRDLFERWYEERTAAEQEDGEDGEENEEEGDGEGKTKAKLKQRNAKKETKTEDEEEEWT